MLWTLLTGALGIAGVAFLLWRKSVVERELAVTKLLLKSSQDSHGEAVKAVIDNQTFYAEQDARKEDVIAQLKKEIQDLHEVLSKLPAGSVLSVLRLQTEVKYPSSDLMDPRKL